MLCPDRYLEIPWLLPLIKSSMTVDVLVRAYFIVEALADHSTASWNLAMHNCYLNHTLLYLKNKMYFNCNTSGKELHSNSQRKPEWRKWAPAEE